MFQKIRIFIRYTIAWILIIVCVGLIGFVLYPLLTEKYASMALNGTTRYAGWTVTRWYPLEITRNIVSISGEVRVPTESRTQLDTLESVAQEKIGKKTADFFQNLREVFSTNTDKEEVTYIQEEDRTYRRQ